MDWTLAVVILQLMFQPSLSVLFTVEAEQSLYTSEFGGDVVMGCRFQPSNHYSDLKVSWYWINADSSRVVYQMDNESVQLENQNPAYKGRVRLLTDELKKGWVKLQVSRLRISDSGVYQCLVNTEEGTDYKPITLSVSAPYRAVTKHIQKEGDEVLLTCQSEGYPESSVTWQDGHQRRLNSNTTSVLTPDQLYKLTSEIRVRSSDKNNYTCNFTRDGYSATFHLPDEILSNAKTSVHTWTIVLSIAVIVMVLIVTWVMYRRQKEPPSNKHFHHFNRFNDPSTRNLLMRIGGTYVPTAACLRMTDEDEEAGTISNRGAAEENLGAFLKTRYSDVTFSVAERRQWEDFAVEELPQRLQNNRGEYVNLQALLPDAGETLLLEGPPGSGKTTIARILVSSWTEGPTHVLSNVLNLSTLQLLLYINCSTAEGGLFHEIRTQLALTENISKEDRLRTVLTTSSNALLLLDEYKEGSQFFDESLKTFLSNRGGCRVLVMACPGDCPALKDVVGTGNVLELKPQTAKF